MTKEAGTTTKTTMRVMCLHPYASDAHHIHSILYDLDERLHRNHNIELVYVNSPLVLNDDDWLLENNNANCTKLIESYPQTDDIIGKGIRSLSLNDNGRKICANVGGERVHSGESACESVKETVGEDGTQYYDHAHAPLNVPTTPNEKANDQYALATILPPNQAQTSRRTERPLRKWFDEIENSVNSECSDSSHISPQKIKSMEGRTLSSTPQPDQPQSSSFSSGSCKERTEMSYVGLDASILHLQQIWSRTSSSAPFSGIIGFGQAAALAALLPLLGNEEEGNKMFSGLEFLILVSGYDLIGDSYSEWSGKDAIHHNQDRKKVEAWLEGTPTLHIYGKLDPSRTRESTVDIIKNRVVRPTDCRRLVERFGGFQDTESTTVYEHNRGNSKSDFVRRSKELNVIGKFLVKQKNNLFQVHGKRNASVLVETQRQLAEAERNAANVVASEIARNPPKALMAVIAPNAVGGWMGPKERDPTDGGGAPCPAEFTKKQDDRSTKTNDSGVSWKRSSYRRYADCEVEMNQSGKGDEGKFECASREHPNSE